MSGGGSGHLLSTKMHRLLLEAVYNAMGTSSAISGARTADGISTTIFDRIEALRAEGVTKSAKQKAVLDLLKEMRGQGLNQGRGQLRVVEDPVIFAYLPEPWPTDSLVVDGQGLIPSSIDLTPTTLQAYEDGSKYFFRSLAELTSFRSDALRPTAKDIPSTQARAMLGLAEALHVLVVQQRSLLAIAGQSLGQLVAEACWTVDAAHVLMQDSEKKRALVPPSQGRLSEVSLLSARSCRRAWSRWRRSACCGRAWQQLEVPPVPTNTCNP